MRETGWLMRCVFFIAIFGFQGDVSWGRDLLLQSVRSYCVSLFSNPYFHPHFFFVRMERGESALFSIKSFLGNSRQVS